MCSSKGDGITWHSSFPAHVHSSVTLIISRKLKMPEHVESVLLCCWLKHINKKQMFLLIKTYSF